MHYVHERMELNFNKELLFIILLFEMKASVYFSIKIFSNYRDVEKESRKKIEKKLSKMSQSERERMDEAGKVALVESRPRRTRRRTECNCYYFFSFKF